MRLFDMGLLNDIIKDIFYMFISALDVLISFVMPAY